MAGLRNKFERYNRLINLVDFGGVYLCKEVLFKKECWPTDGRLLYDHLRGSTFRNCRIPEQKDVVFPPTRETDIDKFDLSLFTELISKIFGNKYESLVRDLRSMRNILLHRGDKMISKDEFDKIWESYSNLLENHGLDLRLIEEFRLEDNVIFITQGIIKYNYYISKILLFDIKLLLFFSIK